jgi:hypothetical protein
LRDGRNGTFLAQVGRRFLQGGNVWFRLRLRAIVGNHNSDTTDQAHKQGKKYQALYSPRLIPWGGLMVNVIRFIDIIVVDDFIRVVNHRLFFGFTAEFVLVFIFELAGMELIV